TGAGRMFRLGEERTCRPWRSCQCVSDRAVTLNTLKTAQNSYNIVKQQYKVGTTRELALRQSEGVVEQAQADYTAFRRCRAQAGIAARRSRKVAKTGVGKKRSREAHASPGPFPVGWDGDGPSGRA